MNKSVVSRESDDKDKHRIAELHKAAFGEKEGSVLARLVLDLLADKTAQPLLSLLAEDEENLVAHILFTPVSIQDASVTGGFILAPLAVEPEYQGNGIGTELIRQGLKGLKERGAEYVLVLGDPGYYSRAGFTLNHEIRPPYSIDNPEAWLAQELKEGSLSKISGTVQCAAPLHSREHW